MKNPGRRVTGQGIGNRGTVIGGPVRREGTGATQKVIGMRLIAKTALALTMLALAVPVAAATAAKVQRSNFRNGTPGGEAREFSALVGYWHIDQDGGRRVYAVDGRTREQGLLAAGVQQKAKALYGEKSSEFLKNLEAYRYFPLAVDNEIKAFRNGSVEVSFKGVGGRIDQAAGIAFNIRPNGEYLVLRANALENNLVLFSMEQGKRSSVQWARNVVTPSTHWHSLKLVINGKTIEGYLNNRKYLEYTWKENIDGRIGLWSKADSYVFFDNLMVESR